MENAFPLTQEQSNDLHTKAKRAIERHPEWSIEFAASCLGMWVLPGGRLSNTVLAQTRRDIVLDVMSELHKERTNVQ